MCFFWLISVCVMTHSWNTSASLVKRNPPAPMNHVKYLRASPAEMPFPNWYTANTNHFHLTDSVRWKSTMQLYWVINPVPHNLVRRIRFCRIKSPEQDFKYCTERYKIIFWNLFTCKGTYMIDWVGRTSASLSEIIWNSASRCWKISDTYLKFFFCNKRKRNTSASLVKRNIQETHRHRCVCHDSFLKRNTASLVR